MFPFAERGSSSRQQPICPGVPVDRPRRPFRSKTLPRAPWPHCEAPARPSTEETKTRGQKFRHRNRKSTPSPFSSFPGSSRPPDRLHPAGSAPRSLPPPPPPLPDCHSVTAAKGRRKSRGRPRSARQVQNVIEKFARWLPAQALPRAAPLYRFCYRDIAIATPAEPRTASRQRTGALAQTL